jgi:hypothetical protein
MGRALVILNSPSARAKAALWIDKAPQGTRVEFRASKRSLPQNDRLWAMLTILSEQLQWHGQRLSPEDWKLVMMAALNREMRIVPAIDGRGFVNLGTSTSALTVSEMVALQDLIEAFAAQHGVTLDHKEQVA